MIFHIFLHIFWSEKIDTPVCRLNFSWKCDRPSPEMRAIVISRFLTKDTQGINEKHHTFWMKNRDFSSFFAYIVYQKKSTRRYVNRNSWLILWFSYENLIYFFENQWFFISFRKSAHVYRDRLHSSYAKHSHLVHYELPKTL